MFKFGKGGDKDDKKGAFGKGGKGDKDDKKGADCKDDDRAKRKLGGRVGPLKGSAAMRHIDTTKRGGGGCDANPFTSARHGTPATGRRV
jgi:hypothetical protein